MKTLTPEELGTQGYGFIGLTGEKTSLRLYIPGNKGEEIYHIMPEDVYEHKNYPKCPKCKEKFVPIGDYKRCFKCRFNHNG